MFETNGRSVHRCAGRYLTQLVYVVMYIVISSIRLSVSNY